MPIALKTIEDKTPFVTVKHLSAKELNKIKIPLPSLDEQRKIAAVLDKVSDLIAKRYQQLDKLDLLVKSKFEEMFGEQFNMRRIRLGEIAKASIGLTYKPDNKSDMGTIVLRSGNIQNSELSLADDIVRVTDVKIPEYKYIRPNDILMCSRNGSANLVGKCCLIRTPPEKMSFGAFMTVIRSDFPAFLYGYFQSHFFKEQLTNVGTTSINQITTKMLYDYEVIQPLQEDEFAFSALLEQVDKSKATIRQSLAKLETLKKALMQQYFG